MKLDFRLEFEFYKLEFYKLEFQKSGMSIYISKTVVDPYVFCQIVVFGHFGQGEGT